MKEKLAMIFDKVTSPKAYTTYAVLGIGVTVALAIMNTRKQCKKEFEKKSQQDIFEKEFTKEEVAEEIKETARTYAPTLVSAAATIFFMNKAEVKWDHYSAMLNTAYLHTERRNLQLQGSIPGMIAATVIEGIRRRREQENKKWFMIPAIGFFPDLYFQASETDMWYALYHLNRNYQIRGSASLREFLAFLNVLEQFDDPIIRKQIQEEGDYFGWNIDVQLEDEPEIIPWIEFRFETVTIDDGTEIIKITPDIWTYPPFYSKDRLAYGYMLHPCE